MKFGIIGLGRMGANLALHALEQGHTVVGYNRDATKVEELVDAGGEGAHSIGELAQELESPRVAFVYVPHGGPTASVLEELCEVFGEGDIVIDGGNSLWSPDEGLHAKFEREGIRYLDMGTSLSLIHI